MKVMPIPAISGALAREDGMIKMPNCTAVMPNGGVRTYETKWVRGTKTRSSSTARHEYFGIVYRGKNYKVHRLVCEAFHGPAPDDKQLVMHGDEDALNNRPNNLQWGSQRENLNAPGFILYCQSRTGERSPRSINKARRSVGVGRDAP